MLFSSLRTVIPVCTCTICRGIGTLSWPPSPPLPPRALKGAARVPTHQRESERDGPMLQKGTEQEAVRWMGWRAGDGAQNKRKAQNTMLRKERWTLCLLPLCSDADARVCVCNALYVCTNIYTYIYIYKYILYINFFHNFSFSRTAGTFEKIYPERFAANPCCLHPAPIFPPPQLHSALSLIGETPAKMGGGWGKSPGRNLKCI